MGHTALTIFTNLKIARSHAQKVFFASSESAFTISKHFAVFVCFVISPHNLLPLRQSLSSHNHFSFPPETPPGGKSPLLNFHQTYPSLMRPVLPVTHTPFHTDALTLHPAENDMLPVSTPQI